MKYGIHTVGIGIGAFALITLFQNCGGNFESKDLSYSRVSLSSSPSGSPSGSQANLDGTGQEPAVSVLQSGAAPTAAAPAPVSSAAPSSSSRAPSSTQSGSSAASASSSMPAVQSTLLVAPSLKCGDNLYPADWSDRIFRGVDMLYVMLHYEDPSNSIRGMHWEQLAGPTNAKIVSPRNSTTQLTGVKTGIYRFLITVDYAERSDADYTRSVSCEIYVGLPSSAQDEMLMYNVTFRPRIRNK